MFLYVRTYIFLMIHCRIIHKSQLIVLVGVLFNDVNTKINAKNAAVATV